MARAPVYKTATTKEDDAFTKIAKYVPAEVLSFFLAGTAIAAGMTGGTPAVVLWGVLALGVVATPLWLAMRARDEKPPRKLPAFTYVLAIVAFLVWAFASSVDARALIGMDESIAHLILLATVLLIAPIDSLLAPKAPAGMVGMNTAAHGYIEMKLTAPPANQAAAEALLKKLKNDMWKAAAGWQDKPKRILTGLMEDDARGRVGKTPNKVTKFDPGKEILIFVEFNPLTRGQDIAHEQLHELMEAARGSSSFGLANHWCCYWDD